MLEFRKRTGYLFLAIMLAQVILVSAQVQTKTGMHLLQAVTFEVFSRVEFGTASMLNFSRHGWTNYIALRGVHGQNEELRRRVADLEVRLQQEHALASRSERAASACSCCSRTSRSATRRRSSSFCACTPRSAT